MDKKCFGANRLKNAEIFLRQQLALVFADHVKLETKTAGISEPTSSQAVAEDQDWTDDSAGEEELAEEEDVFVNVWDDDESM